MKDMFLLKLQYVLAGTFLGTSHQPTPVDTLQTETVVETIWTVSLQLFFRPYSLVDITGVAWLCEELMLLFPCRGDMTVPHNPWVHS